MKHPCVYILCNRPYGTFYVGVTSDLSNRMSQHALGLIEGFTKRHEIAQLVYYEMHKTMPDAIAREKLLKRWHRPWKYRIIEDMNPEWDDLYDRATGAIAFGSAEGLRVSRDAERD